MHEKLSSSLTFYHKVLLPALWVIGFGLGTLAIWFDFFDQPSKPDEEIKLIFSAVWIVGSAIMLRDTYRLKTVIVDNDDLVVKDFTRVVRIPLRDINHISESRFFNPKTISITVNPPCEFGDKIVFIPRFTFHFSFILLREHPIVLKLRGLSGT